MTKKSSSSRGDVYSAGCASRVALALIGSKWALLIVPLLDAGPVRNGEFMRKIEGISQKMLTQTLRELERNGLVGRIDYQTVPPHVEYQLTALGRSLSKTLVVVDQWAEANIGKLVSAQQAFDRAAAG